MALARAPATNKLWKEVEEWKKAVATTRAEDIYGAAMTLLLERRAMQPELRRSRRPRAGSVPGQSRHCWVALRRWLKGDAAYDIDSVWRSMPDGYEFDCTTPERPGRKNSAERGYRGACRPGECSEAGVWWIPEGPGTRGERKRTVEEAVLLVLGQCRVCRRLGYKSYGHEYRQDTQHDTREQADGKAGL